ncbi:MAG: hypothetical protein ACREGE_02845 [Candidatus Microsaccharimonas sp.]
MSNKAKKKRNKQYRGADAALIKPSITRISAANRSKVGQWWFEHKKIAKPIIITAVVIILVVWLILELVRIATQ